MISVKEANEHNYVAFQSQNTSWTPPASHTHTHTHTHTHRRISVCVVIRGFQSTRCGFAGGEGGGGSGRGVQLVRDSDTPLYITPKRDAEFTMLIPARLAAASGPLHTQR